MKRAGVLAAALTGAAACAAGVAASLERNAPLPMDVRVYRDTSSGALEMRLTGRVPTSAVGSRVDILGRDCVYRSDRLIRIARTQAGGRWEVVLGGGFGMPGDFESGLTYRARWRGRSSETFTFRSRIHPAVTKVRGRDAYRVEVGSGSYYGPAQNLAGKFVVLQRLVDRRWLDVRRQRLRRVEAGRFATTFVVRTPGLTLRALVPTKTARPCYNPGATPIFRS